MVKQTVLLLTLGTFLTLAYAAEVEIKNIVKNDCERKSKAKDQLTMHYKGSLSDGTEFDSSYKRGEPFSFQIGVGQVIKGWDESLLDICPGDKMELTIPPEMGYGEQGAGDVIPGGATLHFEVELLEINDGPPSQNIFKQIDLDDNKAISKEELVNYIKVQSEGQELGEDQSPEKLTEEIFQHEDKDKDGEISYEEFSGPKHDEL